jgi:demethylmenaquinone methyltransferase/2-methoxy-6-polyprenyl-1,4-benzoquinol methylase
MSDSVPHHASNRAFYDRIANVYDTMADASERPARLKGLAALALQPGEKVLEIGFGTGHEILDMLQLVGNTGLVAGIDISQNMLAVTQRKLANTDIDEKTLDLRVGDATALPWADGSFDAVYSSFTLELFPENDFAPLFTEVMRVLKPGGRIGGVSMATVKPGKHASFLEKTYVWMHRHFPHIVDCRPIDLANLLRTAGFEVTQEIDMEIWTMPVVAVVARKVGS